MKVYYEYYIEEIIISVWMDQGRPHEGGKIRVSIEWCEGI